MCVLTPSLYIIWLGLAAAGRWWLKSEPAEDDSDDIAVSSAAGWLAYAAIWVALLTPVAYLMLTTMWPPVWFRRAANIEVGEPAGICHAGYSRSDEEYAILDKLGVGLIRIDMHWSRVQPNFDTWDFEHFDAYLDAADSHGIKVLALLDYGRRSASA